MKVEILKNCFNSKHEVVHAGELIEEEQGYAELMVEKGFAKIPEGEPLKREGKKEKKSKSQKKREKFSSLGDNTNEESSKEDPTEEE